ncbi:hypothetical protein SpAn4DRAFT_4153 [Sporomusa ovata]|uniref:Uncharacterized protein n=1 Tax=Sporomusa ovata TaxID=2378 RepID=A0A0U1L535_9FIRM|nr:hypothetical protein SpAn4DRAFT_4153 [Sporomusa ovata]
MQQGTAPAPGGAGITPPLARMPASTFGMEPLLVVRQLAV